MSKEQKTGVADTGRGSGRAQDGGSRRGRAAWPVLALVLVLLIGSGVFTGLMVRNQRADAARADDRRAAISAAEQFTLRLDSLNYKDIPGYQKRVSALLTPKMKADFTESFKGFDAAFTSIEFSSKGKIKATGVTDIDADSATVLVIHDVNVTSKGCVQPPYKRMKVELRKIKGTWLVDDFQEGVPGCQG